MKSKNYKVSLFLSLFFNVISKGLLFLVNIFIAYYFGANEATDVYFFLLTLVLMVSNIIMGMTGSVVIPEFMRKEVEESVVSGQSFVNRVCARILLVGLVMCLIALSAPVSFFSWISKFDTATLLQEAGLIRLGIIVLFLQAVVTLGNEVLVSKKYFIVPAIVAIGNSLLTILFVSIFYKHFGLKSIFFANVIALTTSLIIQFVILVRSEKWHFTFSGGRSSNQIRTDFLYAVWGIIASSIAAFFPIYLLSNFLGSLTEFNYAQRIADIPNSLLVIQFSSVIAIRLNELYANGKMDEMDANFAKSSQTLLFVLIPISLLIYFFSRDISAVLFFRSALDSDSLHDISTFISALILATPFIGLSYLTTKALMAIRKVKQSVVLQFTMTIINGTLVFLGTRLHGPIGYVWAYVAYQIVYSFSLYFFLKKFAPFLNYTTALKYIIRMTVFATPIILFVTFILNTSLADLSSLLRLTIATIFSGGLLLFLNFVMKVNGDVITFQNQVFGNVSLLLRKRSIKKTQK